MLQRQSPEFLLLRPNTVLDYFLFNYLPLRHQPTHKKAGKTKWIDKHLTGYVFSQFVFGSHFHSRTSSCPGPESLSVLQGFWWDYQTHNLLIVTKIKYYFFSVLPWATLGCCVSPSSSDTTLRWPGPGVSSRLYIVPLYVCWCAAADWWRWWILTRKHV